MKITGLIFRKRIKEYSTCYDFCKIIRFERFHNDCGWKLRFCLVPILDNYIPRVYPVNKLHKEIVFIKDFVEKQVESLLRDVVQQAEQERPDFDDLYLLCASSGETHITVRVLQDVFSKVNNSKRPVIAGGEKYHQELSKLFLENVPFIYDFKLKQVIFARKYQYIINRHNVYILFPYRFFFQDARIHSHYFPWIVNQLGFNQIDKVKKNFCMETISKRALEKADALIKKLKLKKESFICIFPEARSTGMMDSTFWEHLTNKLTQKGYDTFFNVFDGIGYGNKKHAAPDLETLHALVSMSKGVIGVKSGVLEPFVYFPNLPLVAIYLPFGGDLWGGGDTVYIPAKNHLKDNSLLPLVCNEKLPHAKIYEFDGEATDKKCLIHNILKIF